MTTFNSRQSFGYNKFNRSHRHFTSMNLSYAYPVRVSEVVPGETLSENIDCFVRMLPFVNPAFADVDLEIAHYFVSWNAIDPHYSIRVSQFEGENKNPQLLSVQWGGTNAGVATGLFRAGSLGDYMGCYAGSVFNLPANTSFTAPIGAFLAYHMIIDRYYRNPHLSDVEATRKVIREAFPDWKKAVVRDDVFTDIWREHSDDSDGFAFWKPALVNWAPDYFTTARPTANGAKLSIPGLDQSSLETAFAQVSGGDFSAAASDVSTQATIPALWDAELMQKVITMLEHGGYSYFDYMKVLYGVDLNQSEYEDEYPVFLGGSSRPLSVDTVNQVTPNATSSDGSGLGTQAGQATAYNSNNGFSRRFSKAGFVISLAILRPQVAYLSGISPMFRRLTLGDQLIPALADLSDQPVMLSELKGDRVVSDSVFGYTDRYNEYRTQFNRASGSLRTTDSDWIMSRSVGDGTVSDDWVKARASYAPFQITDESVQHFFARCHIQEEATLPLPYKPRPYVW